MSAADLLPLIGIVLAALIASVLAPAVMGWAHGQAAKETMVAAAAQAKIERDQDAADRRAEKQQDWDRQDLVAARAEQAAQRLLDSQCQLLESSQSRAEAASATARAITGQLKVLDDGQKVIHTLVNSNMTAAMQAELDAKKALLFALRRNAELEPSTEDSRDLIIITQAKIDVLEENLAERAEQQRIADEQVKKQATDRARS